MPLAEPPSNIRLVWPLQAAVMTNASDAQQVRAGQGSSTRPTRQSAYPKRRRRPSADAQAYPSRVSEQYRLVYRTSIKRVYERRGAGENECGISRKDLMAYESQLDRLGVVRLPKPIVA
jgi:hypothetical protein